jgi:hypothetical protein
VQGIVVNVDAVAAIGLEDVARLEARHRLAGDELEIGTVRQDAGVEVAPPAMPADDRNQAAESAGDAADLDRRADPDLEVGEWQQRLGASGSVAAVCAASRGSIELTRRAYAIGR